MKGLWVAELRISSRTAAKINARHGLEPDDVHEAVVCRAGLRYVWDTHPERGERAIVELDLGGHRVLVVLYKATDATFDDTYNLGSAYRIGGG